ncbi:class I SAM-dependent methyltransferase [Gloeocapsopsis dulcis]|uniref:Methyltransferase type 11 n=1 Tax=Gloeocapsopsis dulcis AAB1 = 1H9 TaxID=1433147 RepID=A0A6N8FYL1_9CHRO|nr:class I SAM-dependent methyltransferase [Gloeocapsopsis dulcis]MUL38163.1 methyltransferase type 11 [Gloeocapsopsis dulcis AAB1 = 1H9]WNN90804.1 class I SAM-dependent methyltransferase [Gloeocapsopsis dulcis]
MNSAKEHYDQHLGAIYSWMVGNENAALKQNRSLFRQIGLDVSSKGLAIDLGCGTGFQSIPLAEFGYSVVAIDSCAVLLSQLRERADILSMRIIHDDLLNFAKYISDQAQLVTCMGDTLTHLNSLDAVHNLITEVSRELVDGGILVLTFRDYVSVELRGHQRFIPVRSDGTRILTCFLEYYQEFVEVYDLLHHKVGTQWVLSASSYRKLRLDKNWLIKQMSELGLAIVRDTFDNGMVSIVAKKIGNA